VNLNFGKWRKSRAMHEPDKTDHSREDQSAQNKVVRMRLVFTGEVQGVGFRWRARQAADAYGITGWVQNDDDGSVLMEAQGTQDMIRRMIASIQQGSWVNIRHIRSKFIPLEEHEYYFRVRDYY